MRSAWLAAVFVAVLFLTLSVRPSTLAGGDDGGGKGRAEPAPYPDEVTVQAVKDEAKRLADRAKEEEGKIAIRPAPSEQVLFYVLAGLRSYGSPWTDIGADDAKALGIGASAAATNETACRVTPTLCVRTLDETLQDKSGSFTLRYAYLYELQKDAWTRLAHAAIPLAEKR